MIDMMYKTYKKRKDMHAIKVVKVGHKIFVINQLKPQNISIL